MSVSVVALDEEHKQLIALINDLRTALDNGKPEDELAGVLERLALYTEFHFKHEEEIFARTAYPKAVDHKQEHEQLIGKVKRLRDRLSIGDKEALCFEAINVLKTWLFNHIQGSDKRYAQYLNAHGIK